MAHLWVRDDAGSWDPLALEEWIVDLGSSPPRRCEEQPSVGTPPSTALLIPARSAGGEAWVVVARRGREVRVNGLPVVTGLRVLADRDEIRIPGVAPIYFSLERLVAVEPFPERDEAVFCARCKQEIAAGVPAVRCPRCGIWHHESEELPCWTYGETCSMCEQATDLEAGFQWTPEEL